MTKTRAFKYTVLLSAGAGFSASDGASGFLVTSFHPHIFAMNRNVSFTILSSSE